MSTGDGDEAEGASREVVSVSQTTEAEGTQRPRKAGSAKDKILWISPDFDDPLEEFEEYMREKGK